MKLIFFVFQWKVYHEIIINVKLAMIVNIRFQDIFSEHYISGFVPFFRNKFPGLFQDSD